MKKGENKKYKKEELEKEGYINIEHPISRIPRTFGQRATDWLVKWIGSWIFIILFSIFLIIWMFINAYFLARYQYGKPFDPYPFILLNLVLACLAAIQAPIILMSQNRQSQRDRLRAQYDYTVNKKAEKEIQEIKKILLKRFKI